MIRSLLVAAVVGTSLSLGQFATAQTTVATDPVGFTTAPCVANSDTRVALPLIRVAEFVGPVQSVAGNVITVSGVQWADDQFVYTPNTQPKTYFVLIGPHTSTNPKKGRSYTITDNGANTITIDTEGEDISGIAANTQIVISPYHTLSSVFPDDQAGVSFIASPTPTDRRTEILIPNFSGQGINLSTAATYYFYNNAWRKLPGNPNVAVDDDVFINNAYFIVRNKSQATNITTAGAVLMKDETAPLFTRSTGKQDNFVSVTRPVDVKLNDLGLITSGAFQASGSPTSRTDELLVFNNAAAGLNKSASATYYYYNNAWRKLPGNPSTDVGATDFIPAGAGFIIRKAASAAGETAFWSNSPTY